MKWNKVLKFESKRVAKVTMLRCTIGPSLLTASLTASNAIVLNSAMKVSHQFLFLFLTAQRLLLNERVMLQAHGTP